MAELSLKCEDLERPNLSAAEAMFNELLELPGYRSFVDPESQILMPHPKPSPAPDPLLISESDTEMEEIIDDASNVIVESICSENLQESSVPVTPRPHELAEIREQNGIAGNVQSTPKIAKHQKLIDLGSLVRAKKTQEPKKQSTVMSVKKTIQKSKDKNQKDKKFVKKK
jgi:hypothetical protein